MLNFSPNDNVVQKYMHASLTILTFFTCNGNDLHVTKHSIGHRPCQVTSLPANSFKDFLMSMVPILTIDLSLLEHYIRVGEGACIGLAR